MADRPRFVIDTNVLISAVLFVGRKPYQAVETAIRHGVLLATEATLDELRSRIMRKKFDRYISREGRQEFFEFVSAQSLVVEVSERIRASRDPDDDKFLELAVEGRADYIITGDNDLLVLNPFRGIPILAPADFLSIMEQRRGG